MVTFSFFRSTMLFSANKFKMLCYRFRVSWMKGKMCKLSIFESVGGYEGACHSETMERKERNYYCWDHEIQFEKEKYLLRHKKFECDELLKRKNVCLFLKTKDSCCGVQFMHVSSLLYHYRSEHKRYACAHCYTTFTSKDQLERHEHLVEQSLHESE